MEKGWTGLPYRPISALYQQKFGTKVYKVPVAIAEDCPNRRGIKGMQTCIFCDEWGSAADKDAHKMSLTNQIQTYKAKIQKRYKAQKFLVYFQAYTNSFMKLAQLRDNFKIAAEDPDVVGFVVGTRPDCLSKGVLDLWQEVNAQKPVFIEIGVQSFDEATLDFYRRGHTAAAAIAAIERIFELTKLDIGIHLIFGNPQETDEDLLRAAEITNQLPISNVKLHNLHVLKNTPLAEMYTRGEFVPVELDEYSRRVALFLNHLRPDLFIQRLAAFSSRWEELLAPSWTTNKMGAHQRIVDFLRENKSYQSKHYVTNNSHLRQLHLCLEKSVDFNP